MKKIHILGLALVAVFAFSAIAAASAFAESEWLVGGAVVTGKVEVLSESTALKLCDEKGGLFLEDACIKCSGLDKGFVGPGKADETTEVTGLAGEKDIVNCTNELNCPGAILVEAENLPWPTAVFLNGAEFRDLVGNPVLTEPKQPGYITSCSGVTDLCEGHTSVKLENSGENNVIATFDALSEKATCTRGGAGQGVITGTTLFFTDLPILALSIS
ncbi:MAG: hypothetical protein WA484_04810 [Solirubrobacteraceae bacterium]